MAPDAPPIHPDGNVLRTCGSSTATPAPTADVVVEGTYEVGMQDQAFLGPEAGLAVPDGDGGVELHIATQWLHDDRDQIAACLGARAGAGAARARRRRRRVRRRARTSRCRSTPACSRCAPGGPVKMVYSREESFLGHVHRHPGADGYEHGATRDGRLVKVEARIVLDGGAYASTSSAVVLERRVLRAPGPYAVPNARIDAHVVYTNNPPCGAMRGFGAVQVAFAHEAQMDKLAAALGMDPVELRAAQRDGARRPRCSPARSIASPRRSPSCSSASARCRCRPTPARRRPARAARRRRPTRRTARACGAASATRVGDQEPQLLRGLRRLLDRARARLARRRGPARRGPHRRGRGRPGRRRRCQARSPAPSSASSASTSLPADTAVGSAGSTSASRQT